MCVVRDGRMQDTLSLHRTLKQKIREIYQDHRLKGQLSRVKATLGQLGGKVEKLAQDKSVDLRTLAHAALAQHRRLTRLLIAQKTQISELTDVTVSQGITVAQLTEHGDDLYAKVKATRVENADLRKRAREAQQEHDEAERSLTHRCNVAEAKADALEKRIASLQKKMERSKGIASQFYQEKQELNGRLQSFQHECSVCLEDTRTDNLLVLFPCGHAKLCVECGRSVQACPICTAVVVQRTRLYIYIYI